MRTIERLPHKSAITMHFQLQVFLTDQLLLSELTNRIDGTARDT